MRSIEELVTDARAQHECDGRSTSESSTNLAAQLGELTGASGIAIAEWDGRTSPEILGLHGLFHPNGDHERVWNFFRAAETLGHTRRATLARVEPLDPPILCVAKVTPGMKVLACALWFDSVDSAHGMRLIAPSALELSMARSLGQEGSPPTHRPASNLVFPQDVKRCRSLVMDAMYDQVARASGHDLPVLIHGDTGAGKEHIAGLIHSNSSRRSGPLIAANCAAIPFELAEAELFGVAAGAATGVRQRPGLFAMARGGTLFLDEIAELPLSIQAKLLRATEGGHIQSLGGRPTRVDVRLLAATNRDLVQAVSDGRFREDLYYRVAAVRIRVPSLCERPEDIPALAEFLLASPHLPKPAKRLTIGALQYLQSRPWKGNVRELAGRLFAACHEVSDTVLGARQFAAQDNEFGTADMSLPGVLAATEKRLIASALKITGGNQLAAARTLGISRNGLALKLRRLGLR